MSNGNASYRTRHMTADAARQYDDELYKPGSYDSWLWSKEQVLLRQILDRWLPPSRPVTYLDFACGTGRVLAFVEPFVDEAVGVDISEEMIKRSYARLARGKLVIGDITTDESLLKGPFQLITAFRFLLNAEDSLRHQALRALWFRLENNGTLVVNVQGNLFSLRGVSMTIRRYVLRQKSARQLSLYGARSLLASAGFEVVDWFGVGFLTRRLFYALSPKRGQWLSKKVDRFGPLQALAVDLVLVCRKRLDQQFSNPIVP